jgi:hypothetical protein
MTGVTGASPWQCGRHLQGEDEWDGGGCDIKLDLTLTAHRSQGIGKRENEEKEREKVENKEM